ncbi:hypothetical protein CMV_012737 [Castanea mollissima]|uniref:Uncharacterized protein n=1 Tax=Castanea mollissima TaxID=60419 RepID=A0A8J4VXZ2_9ROSI|nr:hypothetical protein CMV_012737 [Castanea mollissima]
MKTNLWIVAHGGSGMFPSSTHSSGDLCGGELRCVVWWRFGQAKDGTAARTLSSSELFCSVIRLAVVEVRSFLSEGFFCFLFCLSRVDQQTLDDMAYQLGLYL